MKSTALAGKVNYIVAPHAGAWIEMSMIALSCLEFMSPLTQGRGLKSGVADVVLDISKVAPHAGAWIEILLKALPLQSLIVAPHAGAWIEITYSPTHGAF